MGEPPRTLNRVVTIIGAFIFVSMVMQFLLIWTGRADSADAWRPLFDLVAVLVGAVGGYISGQSVERAKHNED